MRRTRLLLLVCLVCLFASYASVLPAWQEPITSPKSLAVSQGKPSSEIASVKQTLRRIERAKRATELADYLSNETAALAGAVLLISITPAGTSDPKKGVPNTSSVAYQRFKQFEAEWKTAMQRHGLQKTNTNARNLRAWANIKSNGRRFLKDMIACVLLVRQRNKLQGEGTLPDALRRWIGPWPINERTFTVTSPTRVKIIPDRKLSPAGLQGQKMPQGIEAVEDWFEARVEEGHWRYHRNLRAGYDPDTLTKIGKQLLTE